MELLYERGSHALPELKTVDSYFAELKKASITEMRPITTKLEKVLSKFLGTTVIIEIHNSGEFSDNFAVLPIYKPKKKKIVVNEINDDLIKLYSIEVLYFIIGRDLIKASKPRQCTAILLHEIGHVIEHSTRIGHIISTVLFKIKYISDLMSRIPIINLVFTPLFITTSRTLNYRNHVHEYNADKVAVKYGYGDDLAEWNFTELKNQPTQSKWTLQNMIYQLKVLFEGSSHPSFKKRLNAVIQEMMTKYSNEYGSKKIEKLLNQYYKI